MTAHDKQQTPSPSSRLVVASDWTEVAKLAGKYGIRYPTNASLQAFLKMVSEQRPIDAYKAENSEHGWTGRQFGMQGAHLSLDRNGNATILFKEDDLQYAESGPFIALAASEVVELRDYLVDAFPLAALATATSEDRS